MNSGKNIMTAFKVVAQTYANVNKMLNELDEIAIRKEAENIVEKKPGYLRWRSDVHTQAWYVGSLIKLYQKNDGEQINDTILKDGPIYAIEINFWGHGETEGPQVVLARFNYTDLVLTGKPPAISDHANFFRPIYQKDLFTFEKNGPITTSRPNNNNISKKYGNVTEVVFKTLELTDITSNTIEDIFQELLAL
ncbi:hypothetical protein [uncultured Draconibacterium sp.]|uniref:hypothetical protein n=1 Tax=uncultured Draconibacterium sp. TaxID=1573823 RepID=UPI0032179F66